VTDINQEQIPAVARKGSGKKAVVGADTAPGTSILPVSGYCGLDQVMTSNGNCVVTG